MAAATEGHEKVLNRLCSLGGRLIGNANSATPSKNLLGLELVDIWGNTARNLAANNGHPGCAQFLDDMMKWLRWLCRSNNWVRGHTSAKVELLLYQKENFKSGMIITDRSTSPDNIELNGTDEKSMLLSIVLRNRPQSTFTIRRWSTDYKPMFEKPCAIGTLLRQLGGLWLSCCGIESLSGHRSYVYLTMSPLPISIPTRQIRV